MIMLHYIAKNRDHGIMVCNSVEASVEKGLELFNNDVGFPVCVTCENTIEIDRQEFISIINKESENFENIFNYEIYALSSVPTIR